MLKIVKLSGNRYFSYLLTKEQIPSLIPSHNNDQLHIVKSYSERKFVKEFHKTS